ncbi:MAG: DUF4834 family protein [Rikenellaceae bacterium]|jgi:hypothetical protein|nr:DUF4834 family protein [Rikenellaceae bacterium]
MKFLNTIFIIILVFYLISLVGRALLRGWVTKKSREFEAAARSGQGAWQGSANRNGRKARREGEITVDATRYRENKKIGGDVGDYVDYEEIKEQ